MVFSSGLCEQSIHCIQRVLVAQRLIGTQPREIRLPYEYNQLLKSCNAKERTYEAVVLTANGGCVAVAVQATDDRDGVAGETTGRVEDEK